MMPKKVNRRERGKKKRMRKEEEKATQISPKAEKRISKRREKSNKTIHQPAR